MNLTDPKKMAEKLLPKPKLPPGVRWGVWEATATRLTQVAPCTWDGYTRHDLESDCSCDWRLDGGIVVHEYDKALA